MSATGATPAAQLRGAIAMGPADISLERRVGLLILAVTPILFLLFMAIAPSVNPTFDDAKYVGVGRSFLDGNGPTTVFGVVFLKHSPLWPMIIVIPERLFGIHPIVTGHIINALSGAITIVLVGYLGWRVRPAIGAIAAVLFAALPYVFDIARTAGIDLPSIALTLAYIIIGFSVVRTGSIWRAALMGAIFAVAFLIKETILPFAVVPFILGILWGVRWTVLARTAAVTLVVASVGMSWWFVMYAGYTHEVYRADFPEWTLIPSAIGVAIFGAIGLAAEPIGGVIRARLGRPPNARRIPPRARTREFLGWGATLVWFVLLTIFFGRTPKLLGASLFDPNQLVYMVVHSLGSVRLAFAFGLGSFLLVADLIRDRQRVAQSSIDLLIATICGIPLVLLVVGVGETPRHYIAELALVVLVGTIGWYHGLLRLRERDRLTAILLVVLAGLAGVILALSTIQRITPKVIVGGIGGLVVVVVFFAVAVTWLRRRDRLAAVGVLLAAAVFVVGLGAVGVRAARLPGRAERQRDQGHGRHDRLAQGQCAGPGDDRARSLPEHGDLDRHPLALPRHPGPALPGDGRRQGATRPAQRDRDPDRLRRGRRGADQGQPVQRLLGEPDRRPDEGGQRPLLHLPDHPRPVVEDGPQRADPDERIHRDRYPDVRRGQRHHRRPHLQGGPRQAGHPRRPDLHRAGRPRAAHRADVGRPHGRSGPAAGTWSIGSFRRPMAPRTLLVARLKSAGGSLTR